MFIGDELVGKLPIAQLDDTYLVLEKSLVEYCITYMGYKAICSIGSSVFTGVDIAISLVPKKGKWDDICSQLEKVADKVVSNLDNQFEFEVLGVRIVIFNITIEEFLIIRGGGNTN